MKNKTNIQNEINETLNLFDKIDKVEVDAFFYTRLSAKMENTKSKFSFDWLFETPILKPIIIAVILFINVISISYFLNSKSESLTNTEIVDLFNQEYSMTQSTDSFLAFNEDL